LSYLDKSMVLMPKNVRVYSDSYGIYSFTRDEAALALLARRIAGAGIDNYDQVASLKEYLSGAKDGQNKLAVVSALKREEQMAKEASANAGSGPVAARTAAYLLSQQAASLMALDLYTDSEDADKIVSLSEEANRLSGSAATSGIMCASYFFRACKDLRHADPALDGLYKKFSRTLGSTYLLAATASSPNPLQQAVLKNADVQKAIALQVSEASDFPDSRSSVEWAFLLNFNPAEAARAAETIRQSPRFVVEQTIAMELAPTSLTSALDGYWLYYVLNQPEKASECLRKAAAVGLQLPFGP